MRANSRISALQDMVVTWPG